MFLQFMLLVFGIIGEQLFAGALHYRCSGGDLSDLGTDPSECRRMLRGGASRPSRCLKGGGGGSDQIFTYCGSNPSICEATGSECLYYASNPYPNTGVDYDSVPDAIAAIMQVITFDTWTDQMYQLMESVSPYVWLYFLLLMLVGGFFVVNVCMPTAALVQSTAGMLAHLDEL